MEYTSGERWSIKILMEFLKNEQGPDISIILTLFVLMILWTISSMCSITPKRTDVTEKKSIVMDLELSVIMSWISRKDNKTVILLGCRNTYVVLIQMMCHNELWYEFFFFPFIKEGPVQTRRHHSPLRCIVMNWVHCSAQHSPRQVYLLANVATGLSRGWYYVLVYIFPYRKHIPIYCTLYITS